MKTKPNIKLTHQSFFDSIIESGLKNEEEKFIFECWPKEKKYFSVKDLFNRINKLEKEAISLLGKNNEILDIGAGPGRMSLYLRNNAYRPIPLEKSATICQILKEKGFKKVVNADVFKYSPAKKYEVAIIFRTYSIFGRQKNNISQLFKILSTRIINKKGKLLVYSSELKSGETGILKRRFIFKKQIGPWFESLYPSSRDIIELAEKNNFKVEKFKKDEFNQFFVLLRNEK